MFYVKFNIMKKATFSMLTNPCFRTISVTLDKKYILYAMIGPFIITLKLHFYYNTNLCTILYFFLSKC